MERLTGPQLGELVDQIIDATKEGRVSDWTERIADIVRLTRLRLHDVDWHGSPRTVAFNVVSTANAHCVHQDLPIALKKYKEAQGK